MTTPDIAAIANGLTRGERLHLDRLSVADAPLARKNGWKARTIMMKGLSEWANWHAGTEVVTPLGQAVRKYLEENENG